MRTFALGLLFAVSAGGALAQVPKKSEGKPQMKQEDRQRLREDMRVVNRGQKVERQRQVTPQERDRLRRDIQDANQVMKR